MEHDLAMWYFNLRHVPPYLTDSETFQWLVQNTEVNRHMMKTTPISDEVLGELFGAYEREQVRQVIGRREWPDVAKVLREHFGYPVAEWFDEESKQEVFAIMGPSPKVRSFHQLLDKVARQTRNLTEIPPSMLTARAEDPAGRTPLSKVQMGAYVDARIVRVNMHHGVLVDVGAEYFGLVPITESEWLLDQYEFVDGPNPLLSRLTVGAVVRVQVHKLWAPADVFRFPIQCSLVDDDLAQLITPPDRYVCPVDWRGHDEEYVRALREAYSGRREQTPTEALMPRHEFNDQVRRGWTDSPFTKEEYQRLYEKWNVGAELMFNKEWRDTVPPVWLERLRDRYEMTCNEDKPYMIRQHDDLFRSFMEDAHEVQMGVHQGWRAGLDG